MVYQDLDRPNIIAGNSRRLREARQFQDALDLCLAGIAKFPRDVFILVEIGKCQRALGNDIEARKAFEKAIQINPSDTYALNGLGDVLFSLGEWKNAEKCYRDVLDIEPENTIALHGLANYAFLNKQFSEASRLLGDIVASNLRKGKPRSNIPIYYKLGEVCLAQGRTAEAIERFQMILRLEPQNFRAHNGLAQAYIREKRYEEALQEIEESQRLRHDLSLNEQAFLLQAQLEYVRGNSMAARNALNDSVFKQTRISRNVLNLLMTYDQELLRTLRFLIEDGTLDPKEAQMLERAIAAVDGPAMNDSGSDRKEGMHHPSFGDIITSVPVDKTAGKVTGERWVPLNYPPEKRPPGAVRIVRRGRHGEE